MGRSKRRQRHNRNQIDCSSEMAEANGGWSLPVDSLYGNLVPFTNLSGSAFETICPGYNAETTLSLAYSIDSMNRQQTSKHILVAEHLKWYLRINQLKKDKENYLAAYVTSDDMKKYPLTYDTEFTIEAKQTSDSAKTPTITFSYDKTDYTNGQWLISCDKLLNNREKFETDGKVTVTAKLKVRAPMCYNFNSVDSFLDVTVKIGQVSLPFSKAALAMHSSYFNAMFFGSFKESKEDAVPLEDVDLLAFVKLINVLFVRSFEIKMNSVAAVLELADRFGMISIVDHLEKLLVKCEYDSEPCLTERLVFATKYSLNDLQKRCLELCKSMKVIKEAMQSPFYKDLSSDGKTMLLERGMEMLPMNLIINYGL